MLSERIHNGVGNLLDALALMLGELSDKVRDQERNVFRPLAQRRDADGEHVQAIEEIRAKGTLLHHLPNIAVR